VTALHTPCHTQDSISFFFEDGADKAVFTGDTLFIGGCGRFFEGDAKQMHKALNETLAALPNDTKVYPGHEYTKGNVRFAKKVLNNDAIKKLDDFSQANKETQGKFTIGDEKVSIDWSSQRLLCVRKFFLTNRRSTMSSCAFMIPTFKSWSVRQSPLK